ncbi:MAG: response regulator [Nitrospirae bacterium]|jgi:DNA-binding response OmpR family regulator|nr:response regulator [Nitrospirota bacterium]
MCKTSGKLVLIVDDRESIRKLLSDFFSYNKYEVIMANNGKEALDILRNKSCSLLITDLDMPLMDGIELVIKIREFNMPLPIIGMSIENKKIEFLRAGADYFLLKPFSLNHLKSMLYLIFRE